MAEMGRVFEKTGSLVAGTSLGGTQVVTLAPVVFADGYRQALRRFRETWSEEEAPREWFFPLFEALNWSVALTDILKSVGKPLDDPVILGLRFVRNRVHHQWAQALEARQVSGTQVPFPSGEVWPPVGWDWYWKPVSRLATDEKHRHGEAEYTAHLADRPARLALDHLEDLLNTLSL
jgi:hypothetical protein